MLFKPLIVCAFFASVFGEISVRIKGGILNGKREQKYGKELLVFRGIPYAKPPVGDLRFRRPLPIDDWPQPITAHRFGSACPQNGQMFHIEDYLEEKSFSENCLFLNVWTNSLTEAKAVMVWIHGGGLLVGSASEHYYQGDVLAAKQDVVVVSLNYRLNALGFLYAGAEEAPGNVGLWDQALALEWIKDNIRYFGGDDSRITLFGESAGGWSVSLHTISPVSRHLFHNAIVNSGAHLYDYSGDSPSDHVTRWLRGAATVGCVDAESDGRFTRKIMECLRGVDARRLVAITDDTDLMIGSVKVFNLVVIDGKFLPKRPKEMLEEKDFKRNVNLLVSTVEDEGSFLLTWLTDPDKFHATNPKNFTLEEAKQELTEIADNLCSKKRVNGEDVAKLYFSGFSDRNSSDAIRRQLGIAVGDYYLSCPTLEFARRAFIGGARVWQYLFNSKLSVNFFCSQWMGVCHTNDIFPMFGNPFIDPEEYCAREREISEQMMHFLAHFAKHGSPPEQSGVKWEEYWRIGEEIIAPYLEITNNGNEFKTGLKANECQKLWNRYLIGNESQND